MTDIADKIYAATGLTLNSEAAAKIGQMIQVEAADRIAEMEAALEKIADTDPDEGTAWFHEVARAALEGEKE